MGVLGFDALREWIAGARMKIVVNGWEGFDSTGMRRAASKLSNWAGCRHQPNPL